MAVCAPTNTASGAVVHLALWGDEQTMGLSQDIVGGSCSYGVNVRIASRCSSTVSKETA